MKEVPRAQKHKQVVEAMRDPLMANNTNASIARLFSVSPAFVAKIRSEVEAQGPAFQVGNHRKLRVESLRTDGGTQPRAGIDPGVIREYRDALVGGAIFPPIGVVYDGTDYWVWDGYHRIEAYRKAKREAVLAEVRQGTRRDAVLLAAGANVGHGLRRTSIEARRAVENLLRDSEWVCWSNEEIARRCCVGHSLVGVIRKELEASGAIDSTDRRVAANGRTVNTSAIGARPSMNGHTALPDDEDDEDDEDEESTEGATSVSPEPVQAPQAASGSSARRASVTLNGDPGEDFFRLLESYPSGALEQLGKLITKEFRKDYVPKIGPTHWKIIDRLKRGPASVEDLAKEFGTRASGRVWELKRADHAISLRDGKYCLDYNPDDSNWTE